MDRYLFIITFILLILEAGWFLGDLGFIDLKFFSGNSISKVERSVGKLTQTKRNVRRRIKDSIVWEESAPEDSVYNHDSILTLSQSSATLELGNLSRISLSENTLIMVELPDIQGDSRIRLKFSKGDIKTRTTARKMQITTKSFTIDASEGAELNLRSVGLDNVEVEILKGSASLKNENTNQNLVQGDLALLNKELVTSTVKLKEDLKWITPDGGRAYTHTVPVGVLLKWEGEADTLWHLSPAGATNEKPISGQSTALILGPGSHSFRLKTKDSTSKTLLLSVWKAPVIHLLSPLPRDRLSLSSNQLFSWVSTNMAKEYRVQLSLDPNFTNVVYDKKTSKPNQELVLVDEGNYYWRVEGIDDLGYVIPPPYKNQIYNYQDLLEAPTLKSPRAREPANEPAQEKDGAFYRFIQKIFGLAINKAYAETPKYDVEFEWEVVPGADHYVVEIDREGNFQKPMTVVKVEGQSFLWRGSELGSYFWRVAAGRGPKMGKFSRASVLDMNKAIRDSKVAKEMGVKIKKSEVATPAALPLPVAKTEKKIKLVKVAKSLPPPQPAPSPSPPDLEVPISVTIAAEQEQKTLKEEKPPPVPTPLAEPKPAKLAWSKTKVSGKFFLGTAYESTTISAPQSLQSEFNGLAAYYGHLEVELAHSEKPNFLVHSSFSRSDWQPESKILYPFQGEVSTSALRNSFLISREKYYIGLALSQVSIIERATYDALLTKEIWLYGLAAFCRFNLRPNLLAAHELTLTGGSAVIELYLKNSLNYLFPTGQSIGLILGADLNLGFQNGQDRDGIQGSLGATLGLSW